uniref:THAP-type domain-containing protein n=1 Tax=Myripristis murdjan TaxID=586833 RepID=A0A667WZE9_9TELE
LKRGDVHFRGDDFNPTKNTRVCSRHFKQTDFIATAGGLRRLKKGTIPVYFLWNGYELPAPRPSVWERRPWAEFSAPESELDSGWRPKWLQIMTTVYSLRNRSEGK